MTWVSRDFGTGAVKITPAHDPNDFALGQRHQPALHQHHGPHRQHSPTKTAASTRASTAT